MVRFIVRPPGILTTPRLLQYALQARRTLKPGSRTFSLHRDFFLAYPPENQILEFQNVVQNAGRLNPMGSYELQLSELRNPALRGYSNARSFYTGTKPEQRATLSGLGFPVPRTFDRPGLSDTDGLRALRYIRRPLRHSGGRGYRIATVSELSDFSPQTEYLQELYPKVHEYRVLVVRGNPLITLKKVVPPGTPNELPWNHFQGSTFVTVNNMENNRLRHTEIFNTISENQEFFQSIDLAGLDVLVNLRHHKPYVVCELNLCPSVTIESNLRRISQYVQTLR